MFKVHCSTYNLIDVWLLSLCHVRSAQNMFQEPSFAYTISMLVNQAKHVLK